MSRWRPEISSLDYEGATGAAPNNGRVLSQLGEPGPQVSHAIPVACRRFFVRGRVFKGAAEGEKAATAERRPAANAGAG
jgi:hypothetical protein